MLLFFKRLLLVLTAAAMCHGAFAFSLLGPVDTWMTPALGYDADDDGGDLGGPKNLGEEWRWNIPTITYGFDASFINYFGTNGIAAVEDAISLFNRELTNSLVNMTDAQLRQRPLDAKRVHLTAVALGLADLKSYAMGVLAENLGLADSERWTWAIRGRSVVQNTTNWTIIKRNFDPFTLKPSSYVNGNRYSYRILGFPATLVGTDFEDAVEFPIDEAGTLRGTAVSALVGENIPSLAFSIGEYYTALSQDDVGGLRYIYRQNNINFETISTNSGTLELESPAFIIVDTNGLTFTNGFDAYTFFTNTLNTNASYLLTNFPGLQILSTNVTISNVVTTTFVSSNLVSSGLFTNKTLPTIITNSDLFTFSAASRTNDANLMRFQFPGLIITSTNSSFVEEVSQVFFLTNAPLSAVGDPPVLRSVFQTNIVARYSYEYANVITNYASATTQLQLRSIYRHPLSAPGEFTLYTNITVVSTNIPSGGYYLLNRLTNANLVAYALSNEFNVPLLRATNLVDVVQTVSFATNIFDATDVRILQTANTFTNLTYAAWPILLNASAGTVTVPVITTNQVVRTDYTFGTNLMLFPPANGNTNFVLQTITFTNGQPITITQTNINPGLLRIGDNAFLPAGTLLVLDTNRYVLAGPRIETFGLATNIIVAFTNAVTGEFITQQLIYQTNSIQFAVYPIVALSPGGPIFPGGPQLRPGVDSIRFVRQATPDFLGASNAFTTNFYTLSAIRNETQYFNTYRRVAGPDILFRADDVGVGDGDSPNILTRSPQFANPLTGALVGLDTISDGGPGLIVPGNEVTFTKLSPIYVVGVPGIPDETQQVIIINWGSFDSETKVPRVYPEDITGQIRKLEDFALRRNR